MTNLERQLFHGREKSGNKIIPRKRKINSFVSFNRNPPLLKIIYKKELISSLIPQEIIGILDTSNTKHKERNEGSKYPGG